VHETADCSMKIVLNECEFDQGYRFELSEYKQGNIKLTNQSDKFTIFNSFISCSHPLLTNFDVLQIPDEIGPN